MSTLDHPNVLKFYECFLNEDKFYIVTEWCDGGELETQIQKHFDESQVAKIMMKILRGVAYLHNHGIVHKDIKPGNIMLESKDKNAELKLSDYGLSQKLLNAKENL